MFCDYHVHTYYSDDSSYKMEDCLKDALLKGIEEICFTDHVDYGIKNDWGQPLKFFRNGVPLMNVNYDKYFKEISSLQNKYQGQITIKKGLEFGLQMHTIPQFEKVFNRYPLDFIILSVHQVEDKEFWTGDFQKGRSEKEYYTAYFQEMENLVNNYKDYSVIGHMDLLKRYDEHDGYDIFKNHESTIERILTKVIKDGKGIELNTSSIKYGLDDLMPSRAILKLYKELGGKIITIGSDSHKKEDLGRGIKELQEEFKNLGYTSICTYTNMRPEFHKI